MVSANCKVVLSCLLVAMVTARLATAQDPPESVEFREDGGAHVCRENDCHDVECRYHSRVPNVIWTSDGPCYVLSTNGTYQHTLNGFCRNPYNDCGSDRRPHRCQQQYGVQSVLCLKINWPHFIWSVERYSYPAYCACRPYKFHAEPAHDELEPATPTEI